MSAEKEGNYATLYSIVFDNSSRLVCMSPCSPLETSLCANDEESLEIIGLINTHFIYNYSSTDHSAGPNMKTNVCLHPHTNIC